MYLNIPIIFFITLNCFAQANPQKLDKDFQIGLYGLQPLPGFKGHQNGSLSEVKNDIGSVKEVVNAAIPYRHWNRVDYPNWDYTGFVINYMKEMYTLTVNNNNELIQAFTPPLYSSFINPPVASAPENDRKNDRSVDVVLFTDFLENILKKELSFVFDFVDGDTSKFIDIMLNKKKRPLGGWYLDDEPLIRNHDIEVIESMAQIIRLVETKIYFENSILRNKGYPELDRYKQNRYLAFDADDLHNYHLSGRKEDAKFYYYNGSPKSLSKEKIYTVFREDTYDVLMPDFYHNDNFFWNNILLELKYEFLSENRKMPLIMPIIKGFTGPYDDNVTDYSSLINLLRKYNISGIWLYSWVDSIEKTIDIRDNWNIEENNLKKSLIELKNLR